MKVGYIQFNPIFGEKEKNFVQIQKLCEDVKADLIVLPELFATGYTFTSKEEVVTLAESSDGKTFQFLKALSFKTDSIVVGGFIEQIEEKFYNSSMLVFKDQYLGTYQKIHLYNKEKIWFSPGDRGFKIFNINGIKIGIMICFDWFFPEAFRSLAIKGAEIIAHPSNLVLPYCQNAMKIRCLVNRVFAVTANRIGKEKRGDDEFHFTGKSQITSYNGEILSKAPNDESFVDIVDIDHTLARDKNINEYNNIFDDRKPNFYSLT